MPKGAFKRILEAIKNNNSSLSPIVISEQLDGKPNETDELFPENGFQSCKVNLS